MQEDKNLETSDLSSPKELSEFMGGRVFDINDLVRAVKEGKIDVVKELLDLGIDVDGLDDKFFTPLHMAAKCGHYEIVELLLDRRAEIDKFQKCDYNFLESINFQMRPDRNELNSDGFTALQWAVKYNHNKIVELLLSVGADFRDDVHFDKTALSIAAENNNIEIMEILWNAASSSDGLGGDAALNHAINKGLVEPVRWLLDRGVSPAVEDEFSYIHCAVHSIQNNIPIMEVLLNRDANLINDIDDEGQDLLEKAVKINKLEIAEWLVREKEFAINPNSNIIHNVCRRSNDSSVDQKLNMIKFLCECGFSLNKFDDKGFKPIHYAAMYCPPAILEYFVKQGFDINDVTAPQSDSLMHLAVQKSNLEIVDYLISKGADINIKNSIGELPIQAYKGPPIDVAYKIKKKLIIEGSDSIDLNNLFKEDLKKIVATCSLSEQFIVFSNLHYVIHNFNDCYIKGLKIIGKYKEITRNKIIENLNKNTWDRREQIKFIDEMLELLPKAKLFRWMKADMKKFADQLKARREVLKTNDCDILEILSKSLKLVDGEIKPVEIIRESLSKEAQERKSFYEACMFNKSAFKEAEKKKQERIKLDPIKEDMKEMEEINKRLKLSNISSAIKELKIQNAAKKESIYLEESNFNPAAFNELFEIGTIKDDQEEIV